VIKSNETGGKTLLERLNDAPHRFDPDITRLVQDTLPQNAPENIQADIISNPTNLFMPSQFIKDTSRAGDERIAANYLGLVGPVSALPSNYTHSAIIERKRRSDSFFNFLELFANELRNLFIQAHRKYRLPSLFQLYRVGSSNKITWSIFALMGFSSTQQRAKLHIHDEVPLYYSGYFADQHRTAICLELMLNDFLGLNVKVEQFRKRRLVIADDEQTRLGGLSFENSAVGHTAIAGATCVDRRGNIRVAIGPVDYIQYMLLMPDRKLFPQLVELVRLYCGPAIKFDIQIILNKAHVPQLHLESQSPVGRLGWDTWALQGSPNEDSEDTIFDPDLIKQTA
jgi:type VI secretion system protein ImpH